MKNQMKFLALTLILLSVSLNSCAQDKVIPADELPKEIVLYLETHFPNNPIIQAVIDQEVLSKSYEVILEGNYELDFSSKSNVTDIKGNSKLPDSVIPKQILTYVKKNYSKNVITAWELDDRGQQVELDNKIELEFNKKGEFLRIDN